MNTDNMGTDDDNEDEYYLSRTEQKKSAQVFVRTGEELLSLNPSQLSQIPTNNELLDALQVAKKIKVGNALKRQLSFIGKLIRKNNHEEIQAALEQLKQKDTGHEKITKKVEQWRDRLLEEENGALSQFISEHPQCDKQKLNQVLRHALKEKNTNQALIIAGKQPKATKYKRNLFILIRENI